MNFDDHESHNPTGYNARRRNECHLMIDFSFLKNVLAHGYYIEIMYTYPDDCDDIYFEKILIRDIYHLNEFAERFGNLAGAAAICGIEFHHRDHYIFTAR